VLEQYSRKPNLPLRVTQINLNYAKLTNKEEEIMHILWKLKSVRKRTDGGNNRRQPHYNTLSTIVRNLEQKNTLLNAYGKTHQYYPIIAIEDYRKGL
jgi:predicted transcriptional regulator